MATHVLVLAQAVNVPDASSLLAALRDGRDRHRTVRRGGHETVQVAVKSHAVDGQSGSGQQLVRTAQGLHRLGLSLPCTISGTDAVRIAYYTGCTSRQIGGHDGSITPDGLRATALRMPVAFILSASGGARLRPHPRLAADSPAHTRLLCAHLASVASVSPSPSAPAG